MCSQWNDWRKNIGKKLCNKRFWSKLKTWINRKNIEFFLLVKYWTNIAIWMPLAIHFYSFHFHWTFEITLLLNFLWIHFYWSIVINRKIIQKMWCYLLDGWLILILVKTRVKKYQIFIKNVENQTNKVNHSFFLLGISFKSIIFVVFEQFQYICTPKTS